MRRGDATPWNQNPHNNTSSTVYKDEKSVTLSLDLPGVKISDIKILIVDKNTLLVSAERKSGDKVITNHSEQFFIDDRRFDTSNISAQLEDGVLTITIPTKAPRQAALVTIESSSPPENDTELRDHYVVSLDLPGMKASDINLKAFEGFIVFQGHKVNGNNTIRFCKKIHVDQNKYDTSKLNAYLADGVLTIVAPPITTTETSKQDEEEVKEIHVTVPVASTDGSSSLKDGSAAITADDSTNGPVTAIPVDESTNNDNREKVVVETVDENEDWVALASN